jgi:hypothetical protein
MKHRLIITISIVIAAFSVAVPHATAAKVAQQLCGRVFLKSGETIATDDSTRIGTPNKKHGKMVIIENAFSHRAKDARFIEGAETDSVQLWSRTRTDRVRTLIYEPDYGWCWLLEKAPGLAVCVFSPKGYYLAGNGGMSAGNNAVMLVNKNGEIYQFEKTSKMADDTFRRQVASFVADDPQLQQEILGSRATRTVTLRMLGKYHPSR